MSEAERLAARRVPRDPQARRAPRRGRRRRRLRPDARRRPRELPEVPEGRRHRHVSEDGPRHPPASSTSTPGAELADYSGPYRADLRFTDFSKEALADEVHPVERARTCSSASTDGRPRSRSATAPTTMAEIEWAAWNDQVVPELERMKDEFLPAGTVVRRPEPAGRRGRSADDTRSSTRGCSRRAPTPSSSPRSSSSRGCSAATSTCCSASRRGRRRSPCATAST